MMIVFVSSLPFKIFTVITITTSSSVVVRIVCHLSLIFPACYSLSFAFRMINISNVPWPMLSESSSFALIPSDPLILIIIIIIIRKDSRANQKTQVFVLCLFIVISDRASELNRIILLRQCDDAIDDGFMTMKIRETSDKETSREWSTNNDKCWWDTVLHSLGLCLNITVLFIDLYFLLCFVWLHLLTICHSFLIRPECRRPSTPQWRNRSWHMRWCRRRSNPSFSSHTHTALIWDFHKEIRQTPWWKRYGKDIMGVDNRKGEKINRTHA